MLYFYSSIQHEYAFVEVYSGRKRQTKTPIIEAANVLVSLSFQIVFHTPCKSIKVMVDHIVHKTIQILII